MPRKSEIVPLAYELVYRRYSMNRDRSSDLFDELSRPEYIALHNIAGDMTEEAAYENKVYLSDLAERMEATIQAVSSLASKMKSQGYVKWSHDGAGEEGTYVVITPSGYKAMKDQENRMKKHYAKVIRKFGKERLTALLKEMKELDEVMEQVGEEEGVKPNDDELPE